MEPQVFVIARASTARTWPFSGGRPSGRKRVGCCLQARYVYLGFRDILLVSNSQHVSGQMVGHPKTCWLLQARYVYLGFRDIFSQGDQSFNRRFPGLKALGTVPANPVL